MKIGGKAIGSGGFGCIFRPALKCKGKPRTIKKMISKMMTKKHAKSEYSEILKFKNILYTIPNYERYFLLNDITICTPDKLSKEDLVDFNGNCSALTETYSSDTINSAIDSDLQILNIPDGGMDLQDYMRTIDYKDLPRLNNMLIDLLVNGIVKMNKMKVLHADLKESNILMDCRIIDWGLSTVYTPTKIPDKLMNRTIYYNSPFSNVLFNSTFEAMYTQFLSITHNLTYPIVRVFVEEYLNKWFDIRGKGHYKLIKQYFTCLFVDSETTNMDDIVMDFIIDYITTVLTEYTKNGKFDLLKYFAEVYVHIVDVYGFISVYLSVFELLAINYTNLNKSELNLFNALKTIILTHLFEPRIVPNNITTIVSDLKALNKLLIQCRNNATSKNSYSSYAMSSSARLKNTAEEINYKPLTKSATRKLVKKMFSKNKNIKISRRVH